MPAAKTPVRKPQARRPAPAKPKPVVKAPEPEPVPPVETPARPGPYQICRECYPDGWPEGVTGLGCRHGTWSRPWMGR